MTPQRLPGGGAGFGGGRLVLPGASGRASAATARWAAVGPRTMRPGGAGCSAGLLLAVGWLLLAGLQGVCRANFTAVQDPGLGREGEGEGEGEGDEEGDSDGDEESEDDAEAEADADGEGGACGVPEALVEGRAPLPARTATSVPVTVCRAPSPTAPT